ncbi:hypothetical protein, partial [Bacillus cereus]|uniref:hypothetical protein n=1 Tax=Bacillus cereus TaxID=1396 RepID=UPI001A7E87FC
SFEENLAIKNAPPIVRPCLTIGVHFNIGGFYFIQLQRLESPAISHSRSKPKALLGRAFQ